MGFVATVLLALHLISMNVVAAGPLVAIWLDRRAAKSDSDAQAAVRKLLIACCVLIPVGAVLGLALGWIYWNDSYQDILQQFGYRVRWGVIEFLFSAVIIAIYTAWVCLWPRVGTAAWSLRSTLGLLTATNLFYHFPPLFSLIAGAASGRIDITRPVDSATFRSFLLMGEVLALSTHFAIASFAVTGVLLAVIARAPAGSSDAGRAGIWGGRLALVSTLCQVPAGLWLMMQLPGSEQRRLMGEDPVTAGLFLTALLTTFWLLHLIAAMAFGDTSSKTTWRASAALFAVVLLMTGTLQRGQRHTLGDSTAQEGKYFQEEHSHERLSQERNLKWLSSAQPFRTQAPARAPRSL